MDLSQLARKYIWWWPPGAPVADPHRVIAQVMDIGTFEDVQQLRRLVGDEELKRALREARPGEFSERSWWYWHLVLDMANVDSVPPLPVRKLS